MRYVFFILGLWSVVEFHAGWASQLKMNVKAQSAILMNADSAKVIFEKNAYLRRPPASTTKIATLLAFIQKNPSLDEVIKCSMDSLIRISKKVKIERGYQDPAYRLEPDGVSDGIYAGELLRLQDLLYVMMLRSANDPANVLAEHLGPGVDTFMQFVNTYLKSIGCLQTTYFNPHGLHYPNHLSTAYDLALMTREGLKYPLFKEVLGTIKYERPKTNKQAPRTVWTGNRFLKPGPFYDARFFAGKTGYHENAGCCLVAVATHEGRTLISVVLGCESFNQAFNETKKMVKTAFSEELLVRQLINKDDHIFCTAIKGMKNNIKAKLKDHVMMHYYSSEEEEVKPLIVWKDLELPIQKDEILGNLHIMTENGQIIKTCTLHADDDYLLTVGIRCRLWVMDHKFIVVSTVILLVCLLGIGGFAGCAYYHKQSASLKEPAIKL